MTTVRRFLREAAIVAAFAALTGLMTWPWITDPGRLVSDTGDPYLCSWVLWWDAHALATQPLHLFDSNAFYPHTHTLAFTEHLFGVAIPLLPLFALGITPLAAGSVATLLGYVLCGYGSFRLARTLTGSLFASWVAGIAFAFALYRVHQLSHLPYVFAAGMPLLLEALVLFVRDPSRRRAAWLGAAFAWNGLVSLHWLVLTLIPFGASAVLLALRQGRERDPRLWRRGGAALALAGLALAPFLVPYALVRQKYGFKRSSTEALWYSARPTDFLAADPRSRTWGGFGDAPNEHALFPGVATPLLAFIAFLLALPAARPTGPRDESAEGATSGTPPPALLAGLDAAALGAGTVAVLASGTTPFRFAILGREIFHASEPDRALAIGGAALLARVVLAWPKALGASSANLPDALRRPRRPEALALGLTWTVLGALSAFGLHTPFHRFLFDHVPGFDGIRAPIRSNMVALVGLTLLAGLGAGLLVDRVRASRGTRAAGLLSLLLAGALLVDLRIAPLELARGEPDPDGVTLFLRDTPMRGGVVQLPSGGDRGNYLWVLRSADHGKPLVNAVSGYAPKNVLALEALLATRPVASDALLAWLESTPVSYLVVRESWLIPEQRSALHAALVPALRSGRLRFVRRFDARVRNDLYAVTATEPAAPDGGLPPWAFDPGIGARVETGREDVTLAGSVDVPAPDGTASGELFVRGWAREPGEDLDVLLLVDGEVRDALSFARVPRPDVERVVPRLGDCASAGWEARYAPRADDAGEHEILAIFRARDGRYRRYPIRRFTWTP